MHNRFFNNITKYKIDYMNYDFSILFFLKGYKLLTTKINIRMNQYMGKETRIHLKSIITFLITSNFDNGCQGKEKKF